MDPFTNRSRGFGYVTFSDKSYVDVAVAQRDNHYIDGEFYCSLSTIDLI